MAASPLEKPTPAPRPPSPLYRELGRKGRLFPGVSGILEVDYQSGMFGIEFPLGKGRLALDTELVRTSHRFPLAGSEKVPPQDPGNPRDRGTKVFYFNSSMPQSRGSGELVFEQSVRGRGRVNRVRIRLEVE